MTTQSVKKEKRDIMNQLTPAAIQRNRGLTIISTFYILEYSNQKKKCQQTKYLVNVLAINQYLIPLPILYQFSDSIPPET